ncbi:autotransporter-associated beta strand repeat-containing protein [Methylobacterium sp. E-066]|uniref:autotransporter-associated beta strand repeat-containing protein n=1 Tax=Methylobacterium sp. E-066 TaxID=2836584 RepID=UPI001FBBD388|nr:autotransporter-associated beta strand repeat-containing protein [Methylobacterium sp. E-066]MCJ2142220.1 autotransporter-associated beta strand repeat-containing protein [Methylobacterium sp. E-066]
MGAGTLTLTGRNTLSGPITVKGGDLAITGTLPTSEGWFGSVNLGTASVLSPVTA